MNGHPTAFVAPLMAILIGGLAMGSASALLAAPAAESAALTLKTRIALPNVKGRMDHLSVDLKGQRLFATAVDSGTLAAIVGANSDHERGLATGPQTCSRPS